MAAILDNNPHKLADELRKHLRGAEMFRLVSAYFSIYGFGALAEELREVAKTRFLLGEPPANEAAAAGTGKPSLITQLTERGELHFDYSHIWQQKALAAECAKWIERENVLVRSVRASGFLHGKMYHIQKAAGDAAGDAAASAATVGSSNFTRRGLGESSRANLEINIAVQDAATRRALGEWFDALWSDDKKTKDVKKEILDALKKCRKDYSPEFVYYKTLFEIFRDEIERRKANMEGAGLGGELFKDTEIWRALYGFQRDAAEGVILRLQRHNGCILADSTGLGKTYTALAVIKYYEMKNQNVLVLSPKKLENNWMLYKASAQHTGNPLASDRFGYTWLAHTDISRDKGNVNGIDLANFNWGAFDLLVIDESHNFRNDTKGRRKAGADEIAPSRYRCLQEKVIKSGVKTKVLMLSATPVNNSLFDLRNQINIITGERDDAFAAALQIGGVNSLFRAADRKFKAWEAQNKSAPVKDRAGLLEELGGDFMRLLGGVTIARSRKHITDFYSDFIAKEGEFPARQVRNEYPHTDAAGELRYEKLNADLEKMEFRVYRPSEYVVNEKVRAELDAEKKRLNYNQTHREQFLAGMMRINFMKRLESSAYALGVTLRRTVAKIDAQTANIDLYLQKMEDSRVEAGDLQFDSDEEDFAVNKKALKPFYLKDLDVARWRKDLQEDKKLLQTVLGQIDEITPARDNKLLQLQKHIQNKAKEQNKKLLVFTAFKDTAKYLYENLQPTAAAAGVAIAFVAGDETKTQAGDNNFWQILNNFSPRARKVADAAEIDVLVATDCVSEGQNLQDCDMVLNYDIHWNPVRLIQRFGRIDRIGGKNRRVRMHNFWPTDNMDYYLKLEKRVTARMALVDATTTGEDSLGGTEEEAAAEERRQGDLDFRGGLLRQLQQEKAIDLEEADAVNIGDFTLDAFIAQLLRYLKGKQDALEAAPLGIFAATPMTGKKTRLPRRGAIFVFRHKNPPADGGGNVLHPHYIAHTDEDGVFARFTQAQNTLAVLADLTAGKTQETTAASKQFDAEINSNAGRKFFDSLARRAVEDILQTETAANTAGMFAGAARGAVLPQAGELPNVENLELVTWFPIMDGGGD